MIGVLDSGAGGVNVIKQCMKVYGQDFVYLVDNLNCPYGNKEINSLKKIIIKNIIFLKKNYDLDLIILGCNTASSLLDAQDLINLKIPIVKTYPDIKSIIKTKKQGLIFATKNTLKMSKYLKYYLKNYNNIKTVCIKDLPKFIDESLALKNQKNQEFIIKKIKKKFVFNKKLKNKYKNIKNIALGCTHFKYIENNIKNIFNNKINIFECEPKVAYISKFLIRKNKSKSTIKVVLTKKDESLKLAIENFFITKD